MAEGGVSPCAARRFSCPWRARNLRRSRKYLHRGECSVSERKNLERTGSLQLENLAFKGAPGLPTLLDCGLFVLPDCAPQRQGCVCSSLHPHTQPRDGKYLSTGRRNSTPTHSPCSSSSCIFRSRLLASYCLQSVHWSILSGGPLSVVYQRS